MDFQFEDMGSVVVVTPMSDVAEELMNEMDIQSWQMWGTGFVVDHRVARDMIEWMKFNDLNLNLEIAYNASSNDLNLEIA